MLCHLTKLIVQRMSWYVCHLEMFCHLCGLSIDRSINQSSLVKLTDVCRHENIIFGFCVFCSMIDLVLGLSDGWCRKHYFGFMIDQRFRIIQKTLIFSKLKISVSFVESWMLNNFIFLNEFLSASFVCLVPTAFIIFRLTHLANPQFPDLWFLESQSTSHGVEESTRCSFSFGAPICLRHKGWPLAFLPRIPPALCHLEAGRMFSQIKMSFEKNKLSYENFSSKIQNIFPSQFIAGLQAARRRRDHSWRKPWRARLGARPMDDARGG